MALRSDMAPQYRWNMDESQRPPTPRRAGMPPAAPRRRKPEPTSALKKSAPRGKRPPRSRLSRAEAAEIFRRFSAALPEPRGELDFINPFTLLVAVVLSAQATDAGVNRATA